MLTKRRIFSRILSCTCILLGFIICGNKISFAVPPFIQVKPQLKKIKTGNLTISMPSLSPDNKKIAFINFAPAKPTTFDEPFQQPAEGKLWIIDVKTGKLTKLSNKIILYDEPFVSWSPDSNSLIFGSKGEIWITDIKNKKNIPIKTPNKNRVKTYPGYYEDYFHSPIWSPKGEVVAVRNIYDIWLYDIKSKTYKMLYSPPEELRAGGEVISLPMIIWSHDSQRIAFDQLKFVLPSGKKKKRYIKGIAEIEIKNGKVNQIVGVEENIEYHPVFSSDNSYVAFFSRKNWDSKPTIFINDLRINKSIKVAECEDEGHMLSWSEDRSKLYFGTKKALWVINMETITNPIIEKKIFVKGINNLSDVFWFPKGDTLYFLKPVEAGKYLFGTLKMDLEK